MKDWKEIYRLNLTDKAETQKYLKHWISANQNIHDLFAMCLDCSSHEEILDLLRSLVSEPSQLTYYGETPDNIERYRKIHEALYKNKKLQNWLQDFDAYRLVEFKGNIFMAKKSSWFNKIMIDTDRNKFIPQIIESYGYQNNSEPQMEVWKQTGYYNGNDVTLEKVVGTTEVHLYFTNYSELQVWVKGNEYIMNSFIDEFNITEPTYGEKGWLLVATDSYSQPNYYDILKKTLLIKIENVLNL